MEKHGSAVACPVHSHPSIEPMPKRHRMIFLGAYSYHQKQGKNPKKMCSTHRTHEKERIY
jgi:hypothetical protein